MSARRTLPGGFSLHELLITVSLISIVTALLLPSARSDARLRVLGAASTLTSDIELAQILTMSRPADRAVVRFNDAGTAYWLAPATDPDAPMAREDTGEPYVRLLAPGGLSVQLYDIPDRTLSFNPQGGVADLTAAPAITLAAEDIRITLLIATTTGSITQRAGTYGSELVDEVAGK